MQMFPYRNMKHQFELPVMQDESSQGQRIINLQNILYRASKPPSSSNPQYFSGSIGLLCLGRLRAEEQQA